MAKPGQSSFRRILLSRLLLLSVPVLLAGVYVTYRKARSTLLGTARQNLKESSIRKGERIQEKIAALKATLVLASDSVVLKSGSSKDYQRFVTQLTQQLPDQIECVQLSNLKNAVAVSTCKNALSTPPATSWAQSLASLPQATSSVQVRTLLPKGASSGATTNSLKPNPLDSHNQLEVVLSSPVYNQTGQLQYVLSIQSSLLKQKPVDLGSLSGYGVVINQQGTILMHSQPERVGRNIANELEANPLKQILGNAIAGEQSYEHLFHFEKKGVELVAGYTAIKSPITAEASQKWAILAVTPISSALSGLKEIQQALFLLTCALIVASFLATVYVARDLARPLEKLRDYALDESKLHKGDRIPQNFEIREFDQLSEALNGMILRLRDWAEELEGAWKEAQTANQLKNEFLANTSHELRTPLNGIIGCLRLVRDGFCDDREEELDFLQRADDAAIHLLGIINDVLDIAKIEAGKLTVEVEPVNLRKLLCEVINLQAVPIGQKGLEFNTSDLHEVVAVRADPAKLKQVLLNVVGNAVKFTDVGSITIHTRLEPLASTTATQPSYPGLASLEQQDLPQTAKDRSHIELNTQAASSKMDAASSNSNLVVAFTQVVISVKDTGIGIDPTQQHKLFRPFVMVDGSTTRKVGGTGLGLAISRNLIELMGGTITLSSHGEGQGTTVEIILPTIETSLLVAGETSKSGCVEATNTADQEEATPRTSVEN
ncbi:MAG: ATP-binding protein [Coleofasciculaceae cyanobacterium]